MPTLLKSFPREPPRVVDTIQTKAPGRHLQRHAVFFLAMEDWEKLLM